MWCTVCATQRWAAQHVFQVRNTQFHSFVIVVRNTQLRSVSKVVSALCAIPQLRILPLRTITVRKKLSYKIKKIIIVNIKNNKKCILPGEGLR
jgi:hypothetical protein